MTPPRCTYRIQLHADFGFDDAAQVIDYLDALGVSHLYCSPYLQAAAGSTHGYDVVDPQRISTELGGIDGLGRLATALRAAGIGQLLDIVPNHMAVGPGNRWWWDVLENGPASRYARFFDIEWHGPNEKSVNTVLVPILGDQYGRVLDAGELDVERCGGAFVVRYFDHVLPVSPRTVDDVLAPAARRIGSVSLARLAKEFGALPPAHLNDPVAISERHAQKLVLVAALAALCDSTNVANAIDDELALLAADRDRLDALLRRQNYRLADWHTANEELDYRRFFNVETLVGVRIEDPEVFTATHGLILDLVRDGVVQGLRVDHVDGLRDPQEYISRLAERSGGVYTVVEKILGTGESLPPWRVAGTSGYEFLIRVNDLFVATANESVMSRTYAAFIGEDLSFDEVVHLAKHQVMRDDLRTELERLTQLLAQITGRDRRHRDHARRSLRDALSEFIAAFPVYRTYIRPGGSPTEWERATIAHTIERARYRRPDLDSELLDFIGTLALGARAGEVERDFALRLQQLTAPVMAKGVEDTAFYRYHRLISLNEVGGDPARFGRDVDEFHRATSLAAAAWPHSMLTLSTHDTKRSADVRARVNVLSEVPDGWGTAVDRWADRNHRHWNGGSVDHNAEYLLYQTLIGSWPIDADRIAAFMTKAAKEAKVHTSWTAPAGDYERGLEAFVRATLDDHGFVDDLERFLTDYDIVERGRRKSLAQTVLLLTCPGVPDIYQGSELWDLSLVDPDNRRPVDYDQRRKILEQTKVVDAHNALADCESGAPKQWMIRQLLDHRRRHPAHYDSTPYESLPLRGDRADDAIAFTREHLAVVAPRQGTGAWGDTNVTLPTGTWTSVLTGTQAKKQQSLGDLFAEFPVAVLAADAQLMVELAVWAPLPRRVDAVVGTRHVSMRRDARGWWRTAGCDATAGARYGFSLDDGPPRPDPRSASQPDGVDGLSAVVDHSAFEWTDMAWRGISLRGAVLYELHVGTFTPEGTFDAAITRLPHLVALGVDAIELLPVAEYAGGRGWGYDGVDLFAPHHAYGGPDGLKRLVDACHANGIGVVIDVVYNHLGPAGNYLTEFAPYFSERHQTNWGAAMNFDGPGSDEVRTFVIDNALTWLRDYHADGLRLDAVHAIIDESARHLLEELSAAVDVLATSTRRPLFIVAETDLNDPRFVHNRDAGGFGLDAAWADEWHHALHSTLTGERTGYYEDFGSLEQLAKALRQAWVYDGVWSPHRQRRHGRAPSGLPGYRFVVSTQNHDQVGNRAVGERLGTLTTDGRLRIAAALLMCSPFTPMLFQGEEWGATTPFLYFTDHEADLGRAVSEGRRKEFAHFGWDPKSIPDPQSMSTFDRSKLDWAELQVERHDALFSWYQLLIGLRRARPELSDPRLESSTVRLDDEHATLEVTRTPTRLLVNLGTNEATFPIDTPAVTMAISHPDVRRDGDAIIVPPDAVAILRDVDLLRENHRA